MVFLGPRYQPATRSALKSPQTGPRNRRQLLPLGNMETEEALLVVVNLLKMLLAKLEIV
jgi:hypothetical protein